MTRAQCVDELDRHEIALGNLWNDVQAEIAADMETQSGRPPMAPPPHAGDPDAPTLRAEGTPIE